MEKSAGKMDGSVSMLVETIPKRRERKLRNEIDGMGKKDFGFLLHGLLWGGEGKLGLSNCLHNSFLLPCSQSSESKSGNGDT